MTTKFVFLLACAAAASYAQTFDRTKPPVSPQSRPYKLPAVTETKLPNGLTVVMAEDARLPLMTVRLAFAAGNKRDPKEIPGLAGSVASMLMQGTRSRNYQQMAEQLDAIGAAMNVSSSADALTVNGSVLADNLPKLLDLMADVTRNATFPDNELALHKQNRKQAYLAQHSQPAMLGNEEFRKRIFGDHPYSHIGPTLASIDKIDYASLTKYRDTYLLPNNAYLILVGKLPARAELMKNITALFGTWEQKPVPEYKPGTPPIPKKQFVLVDRPGSVQADVITGRIGATYQNPEYFPEQVGSIVLGAGPGSRLFNDFREKRGYAYDVHTEIASLADAGTFAAVTQVRNEVAGEALPVLLGHLDRIGSEPVTKEELTDAKSFASGLYLLRLEPQAGLADQLAQMKVAGLPRDYLETYITKINSVEPEQIESAAKKFISSGDDTIVVVGDAAKLQPMLEKIGKFEVVKPN